LFHPTLQGLGGEGNLRNRDSEIQLNWITFASKKYKGMEDMWRRAY
jgi:hypothetical protein